MTTPKEATREALPADLEALMPMPAAHIHSDGDFCWDRKPDAVWWPESLFTADQVREAMLAATERAATVCEQVREPSRSGSEMPKTFQDARWICAAAIRSSGEAGEPT